MRQVMNWIRSSPITVVAVLAVVLSLGVLVWIWLQGGALQERMAERDTRIGQLDRMMRKSITVPAKDPDGEPRIIRGITINPHTIDQLSGVVGRMNEEYEQTRDFAIETNRAGHTTLSDGLFPEPEDPALPIEARQKYRWLLPSMLQTPSEGSSLPQIKAGMPPAESRLKNRIDQFEASFKESLKPAGSDEVSLSEEDWNKLNNEKRTRLKDMIKSRAEQLHVYAQPNPGSEGFPLDFAELREATDPEPYQLWEAQLELWVQQDLIQAIAIANNVDDPDANVINAPVKRLMSIQVVPGYVGLHTQGGIANESGGASAPYQQPEEYSAPDRTNLPRNFLVGPTGRVSNPTYDVRHARLEAIVDYHQLPKLFEAISSVNFMTVLDCSVRDVDEFKAYRQGFLYGKGDAVRVNMVIESLWMRAWTEELMPPRVRAYLGIEEAYETEEGERMREDGAPPPREAAARPGAGGTG